MTLRIAVVAEDRKFVEFLVPAISAIARQGRSALRVTHAEPIRGCRPPILAAALEDLNAKADLIVVGADVSSPGCSKGTRSHRQKARQMERLTRPYEHVSLAIAAPCIEAWLLADPRAFMDGLTAETGEQFRAPPRWPSPKVEADAKAALGRVVADGLDAVLTRSGFEFADAIVRRSRLIDSDSVSLSDWAKDIRHRIETRTQTR